MKLLAYIGFCDKELFFKFKLHKEYFPIGTLVIEYLEFPWDKHYQKLTKLNKAFTDKSFLKGISVNTLLDLPIEKLEELPYIQYIRIHRELFRQLGSYPALKNLFEMALDDCTGNFLNELNDVNSECYEASIKHVGEIGVKRKKLSKRKENKLTELIKNADDFFSASINIINAINPYISIDDYSKLLPDLLGNSISDNNLRSSTLKQLEVFLMQLQELAENRDTLNKMVEKTLCESDGNKGYESLRTAKMAEWFSKIDVEQIYRNVSIYRDINEKQSSLIPLYSSNHLFSLIYIEYEYLCASKITLRKCKRCKKYFIPHTKKERYCNRADLKQPQKTCKTLGAHETYLESIHTNPAKSLYTKNLNAYAERMRREENSGLTDKEKSYSYENFVLWSERAKESLDECESGAISFDTFKKRIALPPPKKRGVKKGTKQKVNK